MYGWTFYDVETYDKNTGNFIKSENYMTIEGAERHIKNTIEMMCLDYNEKLVLVKRRYDNDRELIEEEILKEADYNETRDISD